MKKAFKKYLSIDFLFSKVTDCRHATWLKINFFTGIFYCVTGVTGQPQLASLQFFDLPFSRIPYWHLQLFHQSSFKKLRKCILIQYPKKFSKKNLIPKIVSAGRKMKSNIFFTSFPYLKKCFKVLEKGVHKNLTLIFLWPKIGALRVKMKGETFP